MNLTRELDTTSFSKEMHLMLAILQLEHTPIPMTNTRMSFEHIDWHLFIKLVKQHRVYPVIYQNLQKMDEHFIPRNVIKVLENLYKRNTFLMLQLTAEMDRVINELSQNSIRTIVLKGPVLAQSLYGNLAARTSKDLDILISLDDFDRVENLISGLGYHRKNHESPFCNGQKWRYHHVAYVHSTNNIEIEIHWKLNPVRHKDPSFEALWARRRKLTTTSEPIHFLSKEDLFLFLVSHGARHGWFRLRWLVDIDRMLCSSLDLHIMRKRLKKYQYTTLAGQAILLSYSLLYTPVNKRWMSFVNKEAHPLAQRAVIFIREMASVQPNIPIHLHVKFSIYQYLILPPGSKWRYLWNRYYPTNEDVKLLPLPPGFRFLYFPLRPILWGIRQWKKFLWRRKQQVVRSK